MCLEILHIAFVPLIRLRFVGKYIGSSRLLSSFEFVWDLPDHVLLDRSRIRRVSFWSSFDDWFCHVVGSRSVKDRKDLASRIDAN